MPNIWDNPYPEWTLETGGSMYFIPDAASWPHSVIELSTYVCVSVWYVL